MPLTLTSEKQNLLREKIDAQCRLRDGIPGIVFVVFDREGEKFAYAAGDRGLDTSKPMTLESIFWTASCTKMVTGVACMQLVEQGVLSLDDPDQVERLVPEIRDIKVLQDGNLVEKKRQITLRMLLSHTAGFAYTLFNEGLRDFSLPVGYDEFSAHKSMISQPLVHQPGEKWEYGLNVDWAGVLVERASGVTLNEYFQKNIFEPLDITDVSFLPTESMKHRLAYMHQRAQNGQLSLRDHLYTKPLIVTEEEDVRNLFQSGGTGLFAQPREYCKILMALLNDGTSPTTKRQILLKETVDAMFQNQVPEFPSCGRDIFHAVKPDIVNAVDDIYPNGGRPHGWGLTFMLTGGSTGRSETTAWWGGLPNLYWWCDREKGIGGMFCTQILPFADSQAFDMWLDLETTVYQHVS